MERRIALAVEHRAGGRCEYCHMHQSLQGATFHVEHVVPCCLGGPSVLSNLAWACPSCNLHKANRVEVAAPSGNSKVPLFNPRRDTWYDHFMWDGFRVTALTPIAEGTIAALQLNHERRIKIRQAEALFDLFPPREKPPT